MRRLFTVLWLIFTFFTIATNPISAIVIHTGYWDNLDICPACNESDDFGRYHGTLNPNLTVPYDLMDLYACSEDPPPIYNLWTLGEFYNQSDVTITGEWSQIEYYANWFDGIVTLYSSPISSGTLRLKEAGPWADDADIVIQNMMGAFSFYQGKSYNDHFHGKVTLTGYLDNYQIEFFMGMVETFPHPAPTGSGEVRTLWTWPDTEGQIAWSVEISPIPEPSALWLLASGLIAFIGFKKKIKE